jgi:hypothetical protein
VQEAITNRESLRKVTIRFDFNESTPYQITAVRELLFVGSNNGIYVLQNNILIEKFGSELKIPAGVWNNGGEDLLVADATGVYKYKNILQQLKQRIFINEKILSLETVHFPRTIKARGDHVFVTHELNHTRVVISFQEDKFGYCVQTQAISFTLGRESALYTINNTTDGKSYLSRFDEFRCAIPTELVNAAVGSLEIVGMSYTDTPLYSSSRGASATQVNIIAGSRKLGKIIVLSPLRPQQHFELVESTNSSEPLIPWDVWTDYYGFWFSDHQYHSIYYVTQPINYIIPLLAAGIGILLAGSVICIAIYFFKLRDGYKEFR